MLRLWLLLCVVGVSHSALYVSNLHSACVRCICHASTLCKTDQRCDAKACGPYYISRQYWEQAGRLTLTREEEETAEYSMTGDDHQDCTRHRDCATRVFGAMMAKEGRDCNNDGVTDCDDYARVHFFGGNRCHNEVKTSYWDQYMTCRPPPVFEKTSGT